MQHKSISAFMPISSKNTYCSGRFMCMKDSHPYDINATLLQVQALLSYLSISLLMSINVNIIKHLALMMSISSLSSSSYTHTPHQTCICVFVLNIFNSRKYPFFFKLFFVCSLTSGGASPDHPALSALNLYQS